MAELREPLKLYLTMVQCPDGAWKRVGRPYRSRGVARDWLRFIRRASTGRVVKVKQFVIVFDADGKPDAKTIELASEEFNLVLNCG